MYLILLILLLIHFLPHLTHSTTLTTTGLTLSPCQTTTTCITPRTCIYSTTRSPNSLPCPTHHPNPSCVCLPPTLHPCNSTTDCPTSETCTHLNSSTTRHCADASLFPPSPTPLPSTLRLSGVFCTNSSSPCAAGYACHRVRFQHDDKIPILNGLCKQSDNWSHTCLCFPKNGLTVGCADDARQCPQGETCLSKSGDSTSSFCAVPIGTLFETLYNNTRHQPVSLVSDAENENKNNTTSTPTSTTNSSTIATQASSSTNPTATRGRCVAFHHLHDLPSHARVFSSIGPVWARVLCDRNSSCATPGHMVVWKGQAMMMRTYCRRFVINGCKQLVSRVDSPVWTKGLRVESLSPGLSFTPFAGRFESWIEEVMLAFVVLTGW